MEALRSAPWDRGRPVLSFLLHGDLARRKKGRRDARDPRTPAVPETPKLGTTCLIRRHRFVSVTFPCFYVARIVQIVQEGGPA
jgi:hypothetical protein